MENYEMEILHKEPGISDPPESPEPPELTGTMDDSIVFNAELSDILDIILGVNENGE